MNGVGSPVVTIIIGSPVIPSVGVVSVTAVVKGMFISWNKQTEKETGLSCNPKGNKC